MSRKGYTRLKLSELWDNPHTKRLFNDMAKTMSADPGVTNESIARAIRREHGDHMFRDSGAGGSGASPPETKSRPPDDLKSWKEVLEKLGLSAGLAVAFRDVYSAGLNAVSVKAFQQAFSSPAEALSTLARVGEAGLIDAEPLAVALTALTADTPAARSSALVGSGDISGVGAFVRSELSAGERERAASPSPDVSRPNQRARPSRWSICL